MMNKQVWMNFYVVYTVLLKKIKEKQLSVREVERMAKADASARLPGHEAIQPGYGQGSDQPGAFLQ